MDISNIVKSRLENLRAVMREIGVSALIIPQADPHGSEYIADHWQARRWISGFTGSAGDLVVTLDDARLWADSRYWLQAAQQLDGTGISVAEEGKPDVLSIADWLAAGLQRGDKVGVDASLVSVARAAVMREDFDRLGLVLEFVEDPLCRLWNDRPALPQSPVIVHDEKYAGEAAKSKLFKLLSDAVASGADCLFVSDLAQIAWMLNVRGLDMECNPVVISYLYLSPDINVWFVDESKLDNDIRGYLAAQGVQTAPYSVVADFLRNLPGDFKVAADPSSLPLSLAEAMGERLLSVKGCADILKACRNDVQIAGTCQAMVRDAVAMADAFYELDCLLDAGKSVTEITVAELLEKYRSAQPEFLCLSFETIAGFGEHGAIVHYTATPQSASVLSRDNLLLVDSGATYLCGTTDITRTMSLGEPTDEQRHDFTLVLKGMINLAQAIFPQGTRGAQLDVLARVFMWKEGAAYLHGTGHGVGHCLNVHEGPQSIRLQENPVALMPGMLTSDEPGLYRAGKYGIRCENLILCREAFVKDGVQFLEFETMTLYPFDVRLVDPSMLEPDQLDWLNAYQRRVYDVVAPLLDSDEKRAWFEKKCATVTK